MATATSHNMNYSTNSNSTNSNNNNNNNRPTYNDSFDQPAEPFECDVSAILPIGNISNTSILSGTEDLREYSIDNDSFAPSTTSFQQDSIRHYRRSLQPQQSQQAHQYHPSSSSTSSSSYQRQQQDPYLNKHESEHQDALGSRYLEAENAWDPAQEEEEGGGGGGGGGDGGDYDDYMDRQEAAEQEEYLYQQELARQQQQLQQRQQLQLQQQSRNLRGGNNSYMSNHYDDEPVGGLARLSTIAELSELPSLNITNNRHHQSSSHRLDPIPSGQVVISRDLVLEDLYVEGQDEENERDDEIRRQLMANLKPTDILGPIHETHDFQISSLTGNGKQWERLEQHHSQHSQHSQHSLRSHHSLHSQHSHQSSQQHYDNQDQYDSNGSLIREEGESELSSTALALKREYEELFGSKGAIDSERSGSDVTGLVGYQDSGDLYPQDDEDDDFFGEDDDDVDEQEEEFYAMLDLNGGGNGNMILGNNIPRKPRVLAPPPGSRLPVPGSAIKQQNVPLSLQSNIVSRLPASRTTPQPTSVPATPPLPQHQPQLTQPASTSSKSMAPPATGLRMPQVTAKKSVPFSTSLPSSASLQVPAPKPVKPTGSILDGLYQEPEYDSQPEESPGAILAAKIAKELKEEEERKKRLEALASKPSMLKPPTRLPARTAPDNANENAPVTSLDAPTSSSSLSRATPPTGRPSIAPPKVTVQKSITQPALSATPTAAATANGSTRPSTLSSSKLQHKPPLFSAAAPSATSSASSSPRSISAVLTSRDSMPARTATPTRSSTLAASKTRPTSMYTGASERSPSRTASPVSAARPNGFRSSMYEQSNRDSLDEPLRQSSNKSSIRSKAVPSMEETHGEKEKPEDLMRRSSRERKKELQRELEEIEAEEAFEEEKKRAAAEDIEDRRSITPRKLSVRTTEPVTRETRRSDELPTRRRSDERERERERYSSVPSSPLSPRSPRSGYSSKRSSLYGAHGDRIVPTLEESCKQLAKIRQDIVDLREEIHQDQPGSNLGSSLSASAARLAASTTKWPSAKERGESSRSRRNSLESKYTRVTSSKVELGRDDSFDSNVASSPEGRMSPSPAQNKRFFNNFLGKLSRNVMHGSSSSAAKLDAGLSPSQHKAVMPSKTTTTTTTTTTTYKKGQAPHSMSHPLKPSRTTSETEPGQHHRASHLAGSSGTGLYRQQSQPLSPTQKYTSYEDRHHSGSSGQSEEFSDELAYDQRYPYPTQAQPGRHGYQQQQSQQQQHGQHHRRHDQQHQQQYQQFASNQYAHYFRQADDGSLILSEKPDLAGDNEHEGQCPAQIRPKELVFSSSVAGEVQSSVTLYNRSRRKMHFEILRPAGITVTPSYGVIQPGRDQRLTVHLAEMRGPGRVVVELDGEWLLPFSVSFE
ncbi:hypothetical protein BGZ80_005893 [Entomortierella chlamydospora]|uniref:MSP domain-containing protein n=1 Tax=Entomortierella chlamydospora TaxID=101097 RepID=A0A9P6T2L3_9FUNG|nr:hypothetical protein BGZ79_009276 [Entomortierella chlamydospora]KAG0019387.1 hypothetical protein BGZ80_005893 [Entomortierella chlamydospora]